MARSIQTSSPIGRLGYYIRRAFRPKRIADVVGLQILTNKDWEEIQAELKKISKDTLNRLEQSY